MSNEGKRVRERRLRLGMTIDDLASEAGVSPDTLSDFEAGNRSPRELTVAKVTAALERIEWESGVDAPPLSTPSRFGEWLIAAREGAAMTQEELAAASGVPLDEIQGLEAGEVSRPSAKVAAKLKATLGNPASPETAREGYDQHTRAFLDLVGAYLMRLPEEDRLERIFEFTRYLITGPVDQG